MKIHCPSKFLIVFDALAIGFSLFLISYSHLIAGVVFFPLSLLTAIWIYERPKDSFFVLCLFVPVSGFLGSYFDIRGVPAVLPLVFGVFLGQEIHRFVTLSAKRVIVLSPAMVLYMGGIILSSLWALIYLPILMGHRPAGNVSVQNGIGWIVLSFLLVSAGLFLFLEISEFLKNSKGNFVLDKKFLLTLLLPFLLGVAQYCGLTKVGLLSQFLRGGKPQFNSTFSDPNAMGISCALLIPLWVSGFSKKVKLEGWILGAALLFLLLISGSRSAYLIAGIGTILFIPFLARWRPRVTLLIIFFMLLIGTGFVADQIFRFKDTSRFHSQFQRIIRFLSNEHQSESPFVDRYIQWKSGMHTFLHNPVLGVGLGTYLIHMPRYQSEIGNIINDNSGNQYLQIATEQGVVGLTIFLILIGSAFKEFLQSADKKPVQYGAAAGLLALMLAFMFGPHTANFEVGLVFWFLMAVLTSGHMASYEYSK